MRFYPLAKNLGKVLLLALIPVSLAIKFKWDAILFIALGSTILKLTTVLTKRSTLDLSSSYSFISIINLSSAPSSGLNVQIPAALSRIIISSNVQFPI